MQVIEGATLFLGSLLLLLTTGSRLLAARPAILGVYLLLLAGTVLEAGLLGMWLRTMNLRVRQVCGRVCLGGTGGRAAGHVAAQCTP